MESQLLPPCSKPQPTSSSTRGTTMYLQEIGASAHSDQAARQVVPLGQGRWTWHFVGWGRLHNCFLMAHVLYQTKVGCLDCSRHIKDNNAKSSTCLDAPLAAAVFTEELSMKTITLRLWKTTIVQPGNEDRVQFTCSNDLVLACGGPSVYDFLSYGGLMNSKEASHRISDD